MRRSFLLAALAIASAAGAAGATVAWGSGTAARISTSGSANRARATAEAARLLALVALPPGASPTATEPPGAANSLSQPTYDEATPNLVDAHAWWTTSASPQTVLAYVAAHLPAGARKAGQGTGSGPPGTVLTASETFALAPVPGVLTGRFLGVTTATLGRGVTWVRTDGEAIWLTPRPAWERVPGGVRSVVFTARGADINGHLGPTSMPRTLSGAGARRLVAFINSAQIVQPGVTACPQGSDAWVSMRFIGAGGRTLARAVEQLAGCPSVRLTIDGRTGPLLSDYPSVTDELIRLGTVPVCARKAMSATVSTPGRDGQANARAVTFSFRNRSRVMCRLSGFPHIAAFTAAGRRLPIRVSRVGAAAVRQEGLSASAVLDPDQAAGFGVYYTRCHGATVADQARITLPGVDGPFLLAVGTGSEPFAPCHGAVAVGSLGV